MNLITINNNQYRVKEDWTELTLSDAVTLMECIDDMPHRLMAIYKVIHDETALEEAILETVDEDDVKFFPEFYGKVLELCSDVPKEVVDKIQWSDRTTYYKQYLEKFVIGLIHLPYDFEIKESESFTFKGTEYKLPNRLDKFGEFSPMSGEETITFTESADLELHTRNLIKGKYDYASNIISILCRPEGEEYNEKVSLERAEDFKELPMSTYWEVFFCLQERLTRLRTDTETYLTQLVLKINSESKSQESTGLDGLPQSLALQNREYLTKAHKHH